MMLRLILKRFLIFIPSAFLTLSLCFWLGQDALVEHYISNIESKNAERSNDDFLIQQFEKAYHLNLPLYYFDLDNQNYGNLELQGQYPSWDRVIKNLLYKSADLSKVTEFIEFIHNSELDISTKEKVKSLKPIKLENNSANNFSNSDLIDWYNTTLTSHQIHLSNYLFKFCWNGTNNQFHRWISQLIQGDLGRSIHSQNLINDKLFTALLNTLKISILSLILIFSLGLSLAYLVFKYQDSKMAMVLDQFMYLIYAIPNFWLASILILLFTTPQFLNWFPAFGFGEIDETSLLTSTIESLPYLILPTICLSYGALAMVYAHALDAFKSESEKQYVLTARSKGLSLYQILNHHIFKNAVFPIISLVSGIFLFVISGSFIVEHIFAIPGIGKLTIDSILMRDYPVLYALILLFSVGAFSGYLLSDLLYYFFDPRLKAQK